MSKKIFISADIEGTTGACVWEAARKGTPEYVRQCQIMTEEIVAVAETINNKWSDCEIVIKDAHASGTNIDITRLPENCRCILGWDESPMCMMQGLNREFDYSILLGYHSAAGTNGSPLAHTFDSGKYNRIELNGEIMSEFLISYYTSIFYGVPVVLLSGDEAICGNAKKTDDQILTVISQSGRGDSVAANSLNQTKKLLKQSTERILNKENYVLKKLPEYFKVRISYYNHSNALKYSYYPGCRQLDEKTIGFETDNLYEVLRLFVFV